MDAADETSAAKVAGVVKGKRTKRHRLLFPPPTAPQSPLTSYSSDESSGSTTVTEDEEDMANCLILLACGRTAEEDSSSAPAAAEKFSVYECKTCNKCFSTFQALGGHRASHKKPKLAVAAVDSAAAVADARQHVYVSMAMFMSPLAKLPTETTPKPKVHECSICGAEFSSGQALGGHMRRHRPLGAPAVEVGEEKQGRRSFFPLDLNLPPAATDDMQPDFTVTSVFTDKPPLMFPPAALVGCHN